MVSPVSRTSMRPTNPEHVECLANARSSVSGDNSKGETGERKFVEEIFGGSGVLSSLEHDQVVGASAKEVTATGQYAAQIAEGAKKRLEESVRAMQAVPIGTVTWTGRSGTAGRQDPPKRASASALLGGLKGRAPEAGNSRRGNPVSTGPLRLEPEMIQLFHQEGGEVTTERVKEWCRAKGIDQRSLDKAAEMKAVLRKIATLERATHIWSLRPSFR